MKKVLSVVLAAAMVLGMSVSAFAKDADKTFGAGTAGVESTVKDVKKELDFNWVYHNKTDKYNSTQEVEDLKAGDTLYFLVDNADGSHYTEKADQDWRIKVNNAQFVESAEFFYDKDKTIKTAKDEACLYVKVVLENDFDAYEEDEVKFYFYIYDRQNDVEGDKVSVAYDFINYATDTLDKEDLSWVITVDEPTTSPYKKGEKAAKATIDFDGAAFAEFKMYAGEKYTLSSETKYNKNLSKEYDTDVEVITFRMKNVENCDILFPASKDNKQIVAVVDGELVPVEAEFVKDHKFESGKKANGYLVENAEYTQYAVIDADVEIEVEEDTTAPSTPSTDKTNPSTGANDFVGAAVALAVVSVAAAGALAFKK